MRGAVIALVEAVGIDQRIGDRKQARALMVIDDDDVEPRPARFLERLEGLGAAIDAHRDARAPRLQFDQGLSGRAVALHQPIGDIDDGLHAEPAKEQRQQCRAGRAVDIVIAEDRDDLGGLDRVGEPLRALVHVLERARVGKEIADSRLAVPRQVVALDPAGEQQLVDQRIHAEAVLGRTSPPPRLAADRPFDVEGCSHEPNVGVGDSRG